MATILDTAIRVVRERLDLTRLFRRNACMRHGIPWDETDESDSRVTIQHQHHHEGTVPAAPTGPAVPAAEPKKNKLASWLPVVAASLLGGGVGAASMAGVDYLTQSDETPPPAVSETEEKSGGEGGSLLQYIEDQGEHLP